MGGFSLVGSMYTFTNAPQQSTCRCLGFTGPISESVEEYLLQKPEKTLVVEELPDEELRKAMRGFHLGENMSFIVKARAHTKNRV
jgi:hypothetical protein